jgi:AcrR family transcriptional regulator
MEQLLIAYALDETERFLGDLRESLAALQNPVDRLALYVRAQVEDLSRRHLPPGPAMAAVLSPASFAQLADHVGELNLLLQDILRDGIAAGYLPPTDVSQLARLIHGTLSSSAARGNAANGAGPVELEKRLVQTVRFVQLGAGARFDDDGRPARLA